VVSTQMIPHTCALTRRDSPWRYAVAETDDGPFERFRRLGWGDPRTPRTLLQPGGLACLIAIFPRRQPAFCIAHLSAHSLNGITSQGALDGVLTAQTEGGERRWHVPDLIVPFCMMICSRCYGTLLGCPCWQALLRMGSSLPSSPAVSLRPERSGGFL
jgi:hypothetical protein